MIKIDGIEWDVPCEIHRTAELKPSEVSGLLLDKTYLNDVLGTYMAYEVTLAVPMDRRSDYTTIYEMLNAPVSAHVFVMPYNQGMTSITGRVADVRDNLFYTSDGNYWEGCKFTVISNIPSKTPSSEQSQGSDSDTGSGTSGGSDITIMIPPGNISGADDGALLQYINSAWDVVTTSPEDGDILEYSGENGWGSSTKYAGLSDAEVGDAFMLTETNGVQSWVQLEDADEVAY